MNHPAISNEAIKITLPDIPALCVNAGTAFLLTDDGELKSLPHDQAIPLFHKKPVLVCHAPYTRARLGEQVEFYAFDVLELFAFVHPGKFSVPTPHGLCSALGLSAPDSFEDAPLSLLDITKALLRDLQNDPYKAKADPLEIARAMGLNGKGWPWTPFICAALGEEYDEAEPVNSKTALNIWKHLPEWAEDAPPPPASQEPVTDDETRERLQKLLGHNAEQRQEQADYATTITKTFAPIQNEYEPHITLSEAGTGVGKTLGYLAPSSVWAEKNQGTVWVSTYTKNLQRQIDQELDRLYPNPQIKEAHVATRKGRENYLCLLNLEETAAGAALAKHASTIIATGIMARWAAASKDGDLTGGEFPGWLTGILGYRHTTGLSDRRGECIYSACDHYRKCFIEHSVRKSRHARIVVANHALVMINAALASTSTEDAPQRYIFDEGHHLFDAADSAFSAHLSARETADLRRWILGAEGGRQSRARGLKRRAEDLVEGDQEGEKLLQDTLKNADILPAMGWSRRFKDNAPFGPTENFLMEIYRQVYARAQGTDGPYSLETHAHPVDESTLERAETLKSALQKLQKPLQGLARLLHKKLVQDTEGMLDSDTRKRLDALAISLEHRSTMTLSAWINMLDTLKEGQTPPEFIDWMEVERIDGQAIDVGLYRHHIDPMKPMAETLKPSAHGIAITSATLRDATENEEDNWRVAGERTGARHFETPPNQSSFSSPFNYTDQTKIFVINDVRKDDLGQVSSAYQSLFQTAGGGGLGLFTAISRLRAVHDKIAQPLEHSGIPLYAQHADNIDIGTLVDMFRDEENSCLLGTDAVRDGVDVPGNSLRLIIFDRVPWPRPTILHKARREAFGGRQYDEMVTRMKLRQAFGRLVRRADDKGVFVMLDNMLPSRLHGAFPDGVEVEKVGLSEAREKITAFLHT